MYGAVFDDSWTKYVEPDQSLTSVGRNTCVMERVEVTNLNDSLHNAWDHIVNDEPWPNITQFLCMCISAAELYN